MLAKSYIQRVFAVSRVKSLFSHLIPQLLISIRSDYSKKELYADMLSGLTVAIIALPLAMAISIASGLSPERGIFTAIVAGFFISFLGGSKHQIGGPTAAFIVVVATIVNIHGYEGLAIATAMAGVILMILGALKAGVLIAFIPYPVITGFTSGIAILIAFSQLKDFLGLTIDDLSADFTSRFGEYFAHIDSFNIVAFLIGASSILVILTSKKILPKVPGAIIVVILSASAVYLFNLPVTTIKSEFGAIASTLPAPAFPEFSFEKIRLLLPSAITIALLAGVESLLSAVVADGMAGTRHNSNSELFAQGVANIASASFGGLCATGAIARTAANVHSGAKSPISGIMHSAWLLIFIVLLSPLIVLVPLAALSGILMLIAWNMSEIKHIRSIMKAPRSDVFVLFLTLFLTVFVDLNTAILAGISVASLLFVKRLMENTQVLGYKEIIKELESEGFEEDDIDAISNKVVPESCEVYELFGPLFFGVAEKVRDMMSFFKEKPKTLILRMRHVPLADAAGIRALKDLYYKAKDDDIVLILSGVGRALRADLIRSGVLDLIGKENIFNHIDKAIKRAEEICEKSC